MMMTVYGCGLRVSELVNLEPVDIHSGRMLVHVRHGKGDKDRFTLLSDRLLRELRQYWSDYRPENWLFPAKDGSKMSSSSAQRVYYAAKRRANVRSGHGIHSLRHSYSYYNTFRRLSYLRGNWPCLGFCFLS